MKSMDEIKLGLISLENEVYKLDEKLTKNIRKELMFLRNQITGQKAGFSI